MKPFAEVVGLESVVCVLSDAESDVAVGVVEAVIVAATEAGVGVVKIGFAPPAVTVGTLFWRYSRGCKAFPMSVASERTAKRRKKAYAEALGWNMMMRRCFGRKKSKPVVNSLGNSLLSAKAGFVHLEQGQSPIMEVDTKAVTQRDTFPR